MPDFSPQFIKNLSRLCRIEVSESESAELVKTLTQVIGYFDQLQEVDVSHITPHSHLESQGVGTLREDVPQHLLPREQFLENAPEHIGGMIRVPPLFKQA